MAQVPNGSVTAMPLAWVSSGSGMDWSLTTPWKVKFLTLYVALRISSLSVKEYGLLKNLCGPDSFTSVCCTALLIVRPGHTAEFRQEQRESQHCSLPRITLQTLRTQLLLLWLKARVAVVAHALWVVRVHGQVLALRVGQDLVLADEAALRRAQLAEDVAAVAAASASAAAISTRS